MDLKILLLLVIFCTFHVTSSQLRQNRKPAVLNSQLYSQIFADLNPKSNSVNNNYDFAQSEFDQSYNDFEDGGLRSVRYARKIEAFSLCSTNDVFVDLSNDPDYVYTPPTYKNVTCKNRFTPPPLTTDYNKEVCHRIQGIGLTGCFPSEHDEFHLRCPRFDNGAPCEVVYRRISDCHCMFVPKGIPWRG